MDAGADCAHLPCPFRDAVYELSFMNMSQTIMGQGEEVQRSVDSSEMLGKSMSHATSYVEVSTTCRS